MKNTDKGGLSESEFARYKELLEADADDETSVEYHEWITLHAKRFKRV